MITYDHLWWTKSTYDGWRRLKRLFGAVRASQPTEKSEKKTRACFFIARLIVMLPDVEISFKS